MLIRKGGRGINAKYLGSVTNIATIFKFRDVSGPRPKKDLK